MNKPKFLGSDRRPEGISQICEQVYPLLYAEYPATDETERLYVKRETVAEWDGYEATYHYHLTDGRIVEEERVTDDEGMAWTNWWLIETAAVAAR